jgi:hypothetical protein
MNLQFLYSRCIFALRSFFILWLLGDKVCEHGSDRHDESECVLDLRYYQASKEGSGDEMDLIRDARHWLYRRS